MRTTRQFPGCPAWKAILLKKRRKLFLVLALSILLIAGIAYGGWLWLLARTGPAVRQLAPMVQERLAAHGGSYVKLSDMPSALREAAVDTEDNSFWSNVGIDPSGIARSILDDITTGTYVEGGSTITQQLARNLLLTPDKNFTRKIKEMLLALVITHTYSKDEILEMYLNEIDLGHGAYGVEEAARVYFNEPVASLTVAQCTMLAGIQQAPSLFDPLEDLQAARSRQREVLDSMVQAKTITKAESDEIFNEPLNLAK